VGDVTPTGQVLRESVGAHEVLERTLKRVGWKASRQVLKDYLLWPALAGPKPFGIPPRQIGSWRRMTLPACLLYSRAPRTRMD
jgi:hypothetical protein